MSSIFFLRITYATQTPEILVRKRGFPVRAAGRGSSAEAFLRGRACGSSCSLFSETPAINMQVEPGMCHPPMSPRAKSFGLTTTFEALNEATRMLSRACLPGAIHASYPKSGSGHTTFAEAPREVRGRSAEARNATLDPYPYLCLWNNLLTLPPLPAPAPVPLPSPVLQCARAPARVIAKTKVSQQQLRFSPER